MSEEEVEESVEEAELEEQSEEESEEEVLGVTPEDMKVMVDIIERLEEAYEGKLPPEELQGIYRKSKTEKIKKEKKIGKSKKKTK
ncbi:MAG: hypothetical protein ACPLZ8_01580 [Fervidicoccaceae archaeon]